MKFVILAVLNGRETIWHAEVFTDPAYAQFVADSVLRNNADEISSTRVQQLADCDSMPGCAPNRATRAPRRARKASPGRVTRPARLGRINRASSR